LSDAGAQGTAANRRRFEPFSADDIKKSGNEGDFVAAFLFATLLLLRQRES
jgi:hypothetical protein